MTLSCRGPRRVQVLVHRAHSRRQENAPERVTHLSRRVNNLRPSRNVAFEKRLLAFESVGPLGLRRRANWWQLKSCKIVKYERTSLLVL